MRFLKNRASGMAAGGVAPHNAGSRSAPSRALYAAGVLLVLVATLGCGGLASKKTEPSQQGTGVGPKQQSRGLQSQPLQHGKADKQAEAPVDEPIDGLAFLQHYSPWSFERNPITLGVEIEVLVPDKIDQKVLFRVLNGSSSTASSPRYRLMPEAIERKPEGFYGLEIVSSVMRSQQDVKSFYAAIRRLEEQNLALPLPASAGVHVHIGFPQASDEELSFLSWLFGLIDEQVYEKFNVFTSRHQWAALTSAAIKNRRKAKKSAPRKKTAKGGQKTNKIEDMMRDRNSGLNLMSMKTHETVEFRFANSSLDVQKLTHLIRFTTGLVEAVRTQDKRLVQFLKNHRGQTSVPLDGLVQALGLKVDFKIFNYTPELQKLYDGVQAEAGSTAAQQYKRLLNAYILKHAILAGNKKEVQSLLGRVSYLTVGLLTAVRQKAEMLELLAEKWPRRMLEIAIDINNIQAVKNIVSQKPEIRGQSLLRAAIRTKNIQMVQLLAKPDLITEAVLDSAISSEDLQIIEFIAGQRPEVITDKWLFFTEHTSTPVHRLLRDIKKRKRPSRQRKATKKMTTRFNQSRHRACQKLLRWGRAR